MGMIPPSPFLPPAASMAVLVQHLGDRPCGDGPMGMAEGLRSHRGGDFLLVACLVSVHGSNPGCSALMCIYSCSLIIMPTSFPPAENKPFSLLPRLLSCLRLLSYWQYLTRQQRSSGDPSPSRDKLEKRILRPTRQPPASEPEPESESEDCPPAPHNPFPEFPRVVGRGRGNVHECGAQPVCPHPHFTSRSKEFHMCLLNPNKSPRRREQNIFSGTDENDFAVYRRKSGHYMTQCWRLHIIMAGNNRSYHILAVRGCGGSQIHAMTVETLKFMLRLWRLWRLLS